MSGNDFTGVITGSKSFRPGGGSWYRRLRNPWGMLFSLNNAGRINNLKDNFKIPSGTLLVYKPNYLYEFSADSDWEYIWFHFPLRSHMVGQLDYDEIMPGLGAMTFSGEELTKVTSTLEEVAHLENLNRPGWEALALLLVESVLQRFSYLQKYHDRQQHKRIEKAVAMLTAEKCGKISTVAKACGISEPMLYTLFRQEMGCSPRDYREQFLLRKSKAMLLNSTMGIDEIAEACGMCDRYYFSNRFKKLFGISPAAFRKTADS